MDTSLAEEVQHAATTLESDRFFFMCLTAALPRPAAFPASVNPPSAVTIRRVASSKN